MGNILSPDSKVMQFITKIATTAYLNALWCVCSLPIVTIGASTTALFYVSVRLARNEEGHITQEFFDSFKRNFKQATIIWLIMLAIGAVLGVDAYVLYHLRYTGIFWTILTVFFILAAVAYGIVLMYIFPLLSKFDNTIPAMFKNAIMIGMRFLLCTLLMALIYIGMGVVAVYLFTPILFLGMGLCAFLCSCLLSNILKQCEEKATSYEDQ